MLMTRVIPCLLLKDNKLVKTVNFKNPDYIGDPVNAVKIYNEKEVDELIFLDILASLNNRHPPYSKIHEIATECFMPFAYGGGITSTEQIKKIFSLGVEKVVINSAAFQNKTLVTEASELFGSQSIIIALDVKKNFFGKYKVYTHSGTKELKMSPIEAAKFIEEKGAGEIMINSIDRDGTWEGYDTGLIKEIASSVDIPVIACGGAGNLNHIRQGKDAGAQALALGSMVVYQEKDCGVLINFPSYDERKKLLK